MSSSTSHKIKSRTTGNDVFITPRKLAKFHIDMIPEKYNFSDFGGDRDCVWLDPCCNDGSYWKQFPPLVCCNYCEILEGKDFFLRTKCDEERGYPDVVIIGNPPYSILDAWLKHTIALDPDCFSYLIGQGALTTRRMEWIQKAGYTITRLHLTKVYKWYGMSYIIVCEKGADLPQKITMDRTVWREDPKPEPEPETVAVNITLKITIHKPVEKEQKCLTCGDKSDDTRKCCECGVVEDEGDACCGQDDCEGCGRFFCFDCSDQTEDFPFPQAECATREEYWHRDGGDGSDLRCRYCVHTKVCE